MGLKKCITGLKREQRENNILKGGESMKICRAIDFEKEITAYIENYDLEDDPKEILRSMADGLGPHIIIDKLYFGNDQQYALRSVRACLKTEFERLGLESPENHIKKIMICYTRLLYFRPIMESEHWVKRQGRNNRQKADKAFRKKVEEYLKRLRYNQLVNLLTPMQIIGSSGASLSIETLTDLIQGLSLTPKGTLIYLQQNREYSEENLIQFVRIKIKKEAKIFMDDNFRLIDDETGEEISFVE